MSSGRNSCWCCCYCCDTAIAFVADCSKYVFETRFSTGSSAGSNASESSRIGETSTISWIDNQVQRRIPKSSQKRKGKQAVSAYRCAERRSLRPGAFANRKKHGVSAPSSDAPTTTKKVTFEIEATEAVHELRREDRMRRTTVSFENPSVFETLSSSVRFSGDVLSKRYRHFFVKMLLLTLLGSLGAFCRWLLHKAVKEREGVMPESCYEDVPYLYTWYIASGSFAVLVTLTLSATLALWPPLSQNKKYFYTIAVYLALWLAYLISSSVYLGSMPSCPRYVPPAPTMTTGKLPFTGSCERRSLSWNVGSVCKNVPEFSSFSKLKEYRIDIDEISVALNFTARLAKEVLVAEFMNSTMDRDGCVDTILASTCYF